MNTEFSLEWIVEVADKVKFRQNAHTYRCQERELLVGKGQTAHGEVQYPKVKLNSKDGKYIQGTKVRVSLVDEKSREGYNKEHYHKLINCKQNNQLDWHITKDLDPERGIVEFNGLGVVKTTRQYKRDEISKRMIERKREESGRTIDQWSRDYLQDEATRLVGQIPDNILRLLVEAFVVDAVSGKVIRLAEIYSSPVQDLNDADGTIMIREISRCSDTVRGGEGMMLFIGGRGEKVGYNRHIFQIIFFELDKDKSDERRNYTWEKIVHIPEDQLHTLGQNVAGLSLKIPMYDRFTKDSPADISSPTDNIFFRLEKKRTNGGLVASSGRFDFTYTPLPIPRGPGGKRKCVREDIYSTLGRAPSSASALPPQPTDDEIIINASDILSESSFTANQTSTEQSQQLQAGTSLSVSSQQQIFGAIGGPAHTYRSSQTAMMGSSPSAALVSNRSSLMTSPAPAYGSSLAISPAPAYGSSLATSPAPVFGSSLMTSPVPAYGHSLMTSNAPPYGSSVMTSPNPTMKGTLPSFNSFSTPASQSPLANNLENLSMFSPAASRTDVPPVQIRYTGPGTADMVHSPGGGQGFQVPSPGQQFNIGSPAHQLNQEPMVSSGYIAQSPDPSGQVVFQQIGSPMGQYRETSSNFTESSSVNQNEGDAYTSIDPLDAERILNNLLNEPTSSFPVQIDSASSVKADSASPVKVNPSSSVKVNSTSSVKVESTSSVRVHRTADDEDLQDVFQKMKNVKIDG